MPARLVALDEGADIPLDRAMIVVGATLSATRGSTRSAFRATIAA